MSRLCAPGSQASSPRLRVQWGDADLWPGRQGPKCALTGTAPLHLRIVTRGGVGKFVPGETSTNRQGRCTSAAGSLDTLNNLEFGSAPHVKKKKKKKKKKGKNLKNCGCLKLFGDIDRYGFALGIVEPVHRADVGDHGDAVCEDEDQDETGE